MGAVSTAFGILGESVTWQLHPVSRVSWQGYSPGPLPFPSAAILQGFLMFGVVFVGVSLGISS